MRQRNSTLYWAAGIALMFVWTLAASAAAADGARSKAAEPKAKAVASKSGPKSANKNKAELLVDGLNYIMIYQASFDPDRTGTLATPDLLKEHLLTAGKWYDGWVVLDAEPGWLYPLEAVEQAQWMELIQFTRQVLPKAKIALYDFGARVNDDWEQVWRRMGHVFSAVDGSCSAVYFPVSDDMCRNQLQFIRKMLPRKNQKVIAMATHRDVVTFRLVAPEEISRRAELCVELGADYVAHWSGDEYFFVKLQEWHLPEDHPEYEYQQFFKAIMEQEKPSGITPRQWVEDLNERACEALGQGVGVEKAERVKAARAKAKAKPAKSGASKREADFSGMAQRQKKAENGKNSARDSKKTSKKPKAKKKTGK